MKKSKLEDLMHQLQKRIEYLEHDQDKIETRLNQLECSHKEFSFETLTRYLTLPRHAYIKRCSACKKILHQYKTEIEFLEDQLAYNEKRLQELQQMEENSCLP